MERLLKSQLKDGRFVVSPERSRNMAAVRCNGNKTTELRLRMAFVRAGIRGWSFQRTDLPGKPDFFFPSSKLAVFVDGCFWHGCSRCGHVPKTNTSFWAMKIDRNRKRHRKVANLLNRRGISTVRFWEHQLRDHLDRCVLRIEGQLSRQNPTP
ncbi:MAG: very short patch repair endonuclease [Acidobacteria bacterium]|nr:very short patch repair endonuclease [Acidobacteriota bacterium]